MKNLYVTIVLVLLTISCNAQDNTTSDIIIPEQTQNLYPNNSVIIDTHNEWSRNHYRNRISVFRNNLLQNGVIERILFGN